MDLSQLSNIAIKAALAAGKIIQKHMNEDVSVEKKKGGTSYASQVVTVVDKTCESAILSHLLPHHWLHLPSIIRFVGRGCSSVEISRKAFSNGS